MDSQAIANTMKILNTKPLTDLVTEATIKVCYVSNVPNNNKTVITEKVGEEIASTLPGAPVVGLFNEEDNDFVEHSRKLTIKDGSLKWEDLTKPYGFVSPMDKPWYQDFIEDGEKRKYLMCKAFLWTRQYKEASLINGKGQSMELDEEDLLGYYSDDVFIFTHAILDKLCILGDKYAPCFEGANIMTTYSRVYNKFAEEVENIIGRRYYVLNDKLVEKPEKITAKYALELGWNLEDAIYKQLQARGAEDKYSIQGIYTEATGDFVILQDRATLEYVKVRLIITDSDTVVLDAEMNAVQMQWIDKPKEEVTVEPLVENGEAVATETPASTTSTMQSEHNNFTEQTENENNITEEVTSAENSEETVTEEVIENNDPVSVEETAVEEIPATEFTEATEATENNEVVEASETAEVVTETIVESKETTEIAETIDVIETEGSNTSTEIVEEPVIDYAKLNNELNDKISTLESTIVEKDKKINELEAKLATFKKKQEEEEKIQKQEMVSSYRSLLTDDEINPVIENIEKLSLNEIESNLSITYARKQRKAVSAANGMQVNIGNVSTPEINLPEYMVKAMEYDRKHGLN